MPVAPHNNIAHLHVKVPHTTYSAFTSEAGLDDDQDPVTFPPPADWSQVMKSPSAAMPITRTRRISTKTGQFLMQRELPTRQVLISTTTPLIAPRQSTLTRRRSQRISRLNCCTCTTSLITFLLAKSKPWQD
jgi:hypothetical protein